MISFLFGKHVTRPFLLVLLLGVMANGQPVSAQLAAQSTLANAVAERVRLTGEIIAVPLIENSLVRPVLATLIGNTVYYSDYHPDANDGGECRGRNIYSLSIDTENRSFSQLKKSRDKPVREDFPCILNLSTDGRHLIVRRREKEDKTIVNSLLQMTDEGAKLVGIFDVRELIDGKQNSEGKKIYPDLNAHRVNEKLKRADKSKQANEINPEKPIIPWENAINYLWTVRPDKRFCEIIETVKDGSPIYRAAHLMSMIQAKGTSTFMEFDLPQGMLLSSTKSAISWDNYGAIYLALASDSPNGMGKVLVLDTIAKTSTIYGIDLPYAEPLNWNHLDRTGDNGWAVTDPRYPTGTDFGLLLMDNTTSAREFNNISYISRFESKVYRVQIPPYKNDWGGLFYTHGGILVSHPGSQRIIWYGPRNPFDEKYFPTHKADFSSMSASEKQRLIGGGA